MEYHEFQFCLAKCCIVESLRILSLFLHLHGTSSLSCHVFFFVCASFHPHSIHVWHLDCTRVDPFCLSSFDSFFSFSFFFFVFVPDHPHCHSTALVFSLYTGRDIDSDDSYARPLIHACAQPIVWFEHERKLRAGHRAETRQIW